MEVAIDLEKLRNTPNRNNHLPRDDYRELLDLALVVNPFSSPQRFNMKKPGAHNKARWMCVCIYTLKMFKLQDQTILDYSSSYKAELTRFVKFLVLIYIPYWFKVPLSSDAAVYDLSLYKQLLKYSEIDAEISMAVLQVQSRHLWYLSSECVILWCMFGSEQWMKKVT